MEPRAVPSARECARGRCSFHRAHSVQLNRTIIFFWLQRKSAASRPRDCWGFCGHEPGGPGSALPGDVITGNGTRFDARNWLPFRAAIARNRSAGAEPVSCARSSSRSCRCQIVRCSSPDRLRRRTPRYGQRCFGAQARELRRDLRLERENAGPPALSGVSPGETRATEAPGAGN